MRLEPTPSRTAIVALPGPGLPTDGGAVLDRIIDELAARVRHGEQCAIVWDIDGTLVDTRRRMLAALHAYGRTDLCLADLRGTALSTTQVVTDFGLDAARFELVWDRVFWDPKGFSSDMTIPETLTRMQRAASLGIRNVVMTGRNQELGPDTAVDLRNRGVPFESLFCKRAGESTVDDKARRLEGLIALGIHVGAVVTDVARELAAIHARIGVGTVRGILVVGAGAVVHATPDLQAHVLVVPLAEG